MIKTITVLITLDQENNPIVFNGYKNTNFLFNKSCFHKSIATVDPSFGEMINFREESS